MTNKNPSTVKMKEVFDTGTAKMGVQEMLIANRHGKIMRQL
jgi:hypothetical protein